MRFLKAIAAHKTITHTILIVATNTELPGKAMRHSQCTTVKQTALS